MSVIKVRATAQALIKEPAIAHGYIITPGVTFPIVASAIHAGSDGDVEGSYHEAFDGCLHGSETALIQDTTLKTTHKTGLVILPSDTASYAAENGSKQVYWYDGRADATFGGTIDHVASKECHVLEIERGAYPNGCAAQMSSTTFYTAVYLIEPATNPEVNFRLVIPCGKPIVLQQTTDTGATWKTVFTLPGANDGEYFLQTHRRRLIIKIEPDYPNNVLRICVNNGYWLRVFPLDADSNAVAIPELGPFRIEGKNGFCRVGRYPLRFGPVKFTRRIDAHSVMGTEPFAVFNGRTQQHDTQTNVPTISSDDGQKFDFSIIASNPDHGDAGAAGSLYPPVISDACLLFPWEWSDSGIPGDVIPAVSLLLSPLRFEIDEWIDDAERTRMTMGTLWFDNNGGTFNGWSGHRAVDLAIGNSITSAAYFSGYGGVGPNGMQLMVDPHYGSVAVMHLQCKSYAMMSPNGVKTARQYDGWALPDAVRWEAQIGNVHPRYMTGIPVWNEAGGKASDVSGVCPYYILKPGSGLVAANEYLPTEASWNVLQRWAQDTGDSDGPNYMGFFHTGEFQFGSFNPLTAPVSAVYGSGDMQGLVVTSSVHNLRSSVDLQTLNPWTYELETIHEDMPLSVKKRIGFHAGWLERNVRYGANPDEEVGHMQRAASVNDVVAHFKANLLPELHSGMRVTATDARFGGLSDFYTIHVKSCGGWKDPFGRMSKWDCYQDVTMRSTSSLA